MDGRSASTSTSCRTSRAGSTPATSTLRVRAFQHKHKLLEGFTSRYTFDQLVFYQTYTFPQTAIAREKQIKGWTRAGKIDLIEQENPDWWDLSAAWD